MDLTSATTTPETVAPGSLTCSTSTPAAVSLSHTVWSPGSSTKSASHSRLTRTADLPSFDHVGDRVGARVGSDRVGVDASRRFTVVRCKLVQEAQVVLVEQTNVVDTPAQHGDPIDAEAKGEALHFLGIVADRLQHGGIDHTGARHLEP